MNIENEIIDRCRTGDSKAQYQLYKLYYKAMFNTSLRIINNKREELIQHLDKLDIDVGIHFIPVHKHEYFSNERFGDMTITEKIVKQVLTIPLHSNMHSDDVKRVIDGICSFFKKN